jgi:DNA helicase-2/ATP-dependent DNA helicase PcrA
MYDFTDMLTYVEEPLDVDLMIIDEAQDLTLQQWFFVKKVSTKAKRVVVAGDDDQAIYSWAGAAPEQLIALHKKYHTEEDGNPLNISYRLPRTIANVVQHLAHRITLRIKKEWRVRDNADEGRVEVAVDPSQLNVQNDTWMLLCRTKKDKRKFVELCREQGVVYNVDGDDSNNSKPAKAVKNYHQLKKGQALTPAEVNRLVDFIPHMPTLNSSDYPQGYKVHWDEIEWPFEGMPNWFDVMKLMGREDEFYLRSILRRDAGRLDQPSTVTISTIHASKGGEADHVVVMPDITQNIQQVLMDPLRADPEHRVWYVAASRAKQSLLWLNPRGAKHYALT